MYTNTHKTRLDCRKKIDNKNINGASYTDYNIYKYSYILFFSKSGHLFLYTLFPHPKE